MRILITNVGFDVRSGTTLYVRDLALELLRIGHEPFIYTRSKGEVAREVEQCGVPVVTRLWRLGVTPDVIHGHHTCSTRDALRRFPRVPAIFVCHDHTSFFDRPVFDPGIRRYFGVSNLCVQRLARDGVAPDRVYLLTNFVDTRRFPARQQLPETPRRALVFSNYANSRTHLPAVAEACCRAGLTLDVIGESAGNAVAQPESVLGRYDIVFAKAKAAMEAMATGAAVVLCDYGGVGPAVTSENFEQLRPLNFGFEALVGPLTPAAVERQLQRYDPVDAARVSAKLRSVASLEEAVRKLCGIYLDVVNAPQPLRGTRTGAVTQINLDSRLDSVRTAIHLVWLRLPSRARKVLRRAPGVRSLLPKLREMRL